MTIFGSDISSYQSGLDVAALPDAFVLIKCTEDAAYVDPDYPGWLAAAKAAGKIPAAYHFIGPSDPAYQAAHLAQHVVDRTVPVMIDFEDEGAFRPTFPQLLALADAIDAVGLHVALVYFPRWKWLEDGSPDLAPLTRRGIGLVSSNYPTATVAPAGQVYQAAGGDSGPGWTPYGGVTPRLWQFSDRVADGGRQIDMNAFRGSAAQLAAYLNTAPPVPTPQEPDMPAFATGEIPNDLNQHMVCPPPANTGANWGNVWFSLGSDFADVTVRCAAYVHGAGWDVKDNVVVPSAGDRVNPWGGPLPNGTQKVSVVRHGLGGTLGWLVEAAGK